MQLGTALNLPNPRINFGGTGRAPGKGNTAIFSFETGVLDSRINFSRTTNATVTNSAGQITYAPHNLLTHSEQFDNAVWIRNYTTVTANSTTAPDGTLTSDALVETSATSYHIISRGVGAISSAGINTFSCYAKANTRTAVVLQISEGLNRYAVLFDLSTGAFVSENTTGSPTNTSNSITPVGNGWYRCSVTCRVATTCDTIIALSNSLTPTWIYSVPTYTGDGTSKVYAWGAQLEIGSTATTYNPTTVKNLLGYSELFDNAAAWIKSNSFVQTNLLTYSEDFTVAGWAKTTVTATANSFIAPNGYQTADTLLATGANSTALQTFTASAVPYTFSVYLYRKTGTGNIDITVDGTTWVTKTITAGWTRVDTTLTPAAGSKTAGIRIATNGDEVYAWGAQLVQGSVAGDYRRTDAAALPVYYPNHNGVVCAEKLVENTATGAHAIQPASGVGVVGNTETLSIYAKAGERNWVAMQLGTSIVTYFNLSTGVVGNSSGGTYSITSVGNGWYRLSVTGARGTNQNNIVFVAQANGSVSTTGDGTSGIYIFGAQLSDSASLDPYVLNAAAAPTAAAYYGARFDYDPVTLAPKGLLIEEQRVNYCLWSEDFTQASWVKTTTTVTSNSAIAPSGNQTADTLSATADNAITKQAITTTAVAFTFSVYLKRKTGTGNIDISMDGTTFVTQTINSSTWTRCIVTQTGVAGTSNPSIRIATNGDEVYAWGAQVE